MNCKLCGEHVLATMQIMWNGFSYHADCIGEAVACNRAEQERINSGLPSTDFEAYEDEEPFEDEYSYYANGYEEDDDLEDIVAALDEVPDVSDEVLNQIPAATNGNGRRAIVIPEVVETNPSQPNRREVHINDVVRTVSNRFVAERGNGHERAGTLISGRETTLINRSALRHLPVPPSTETFQPIPHYSLVEQIHESLSYRRLQVVREEFAVSPDGMKLFGLIELNVEYSGVRFAIGLRNSNDKSMRVGLVAGYRVMVCENKMLTGDFNPLLAKHSKNFNLIDALSVAVDRIQRNIGGVEKSIEFKKNYRLDEETARNMIYRAFLIDKFPMSLMRLLHQEFFVAPSYEEFKPKNLWSLENAFTNCFKKLKPVQQFEATAKLGKFLAAYN